MAEPWSGKVTQAQMLEAAELAERMAKIAQKTTPVVIVMACQMLSEICFMTQFPDAYADWAVSRKLRTGKWRGIPPKNEARAGQGKEASNG